MERNNKIKWRDGSIGLKEFYKLLKEDREKYIEEIMKIPVEQRSNSDDYIINFYGPRINNLFIKLED